MGMTATYSAGGVRSNRWLRRSCVPIIVVLGVGVAVVGPGQTSAAWAASSDPPAEPVVASLQSKPFVGDADVVRVDGRQVHASPVFLNVSSVDATLAYSLDPRLEPASGQTWRSGPVNILGPRGVATAIWVSTATTLPGTALADLELERAARQTAIWVMGRFMRIGPGTVPNAQVRARAAELVAAAPASFDAAQQETALSITSRVRSATSNTVELELSLEAGQGETTLDPAQLIDLRMAGKWGVVRTGEASEVVGDANQPRLRVTRVGAAPDFNTAYVAIQRPSKTTSIELHWNFTIRPGVLMVAQGGGPSFVTATSFPIRRRVVEVVDPDSLPDPTGLLKQQTVNALGHLPGWAFWALLILGLYLSPKFSRGIDLLLVGTYRRLLPRSLAPHATEVATPATEADHEPRAAATATVGPSPAARESRGGPKARRAAVPRWLRRR